LNANENEKEGGRDMRMRAETFTEPKPINLKILFFSIEKKAFFVEFFHSTRESVKCMEGRKFYGCNCKIYGQ
jgi:hypothetical protein